MHLFTDYVQPLTIWLYANPSWALLMTFLISFTESLAIIGSIIPGSVTMTAIGILAGSGVMSIPLTFIAAAAGAVAGDSASYFLGYIYSNRLPDMWPFSRYPSWLKYGKDYFAQHGGKSVIVGRFIGPLRSIIPVIAGVMRMKQLHFLFANIISAIGWSIVYVTPGVLIGTASSELSAESATRLFIGILIILVVAWLIGQTMKWLYRHGYNFLRTQLHGCWMWALHYSRFEPLLKKLTPSSEKNHFATAGLILLFSLCCLMSISLILLVKHNTWVATINNPCFLFLQSLRTQPFDAFFIVINLMFSSIALVTVMIVISISALYYQDWRLLRYWLSLIVTTCFITYFLEYCVAIPKPDSLGQFNAHPKFPDINLTLATSLFAFLIAYVNAHYRKATLFIVKIVFISLLFLGGLSPLYLGDNWITSVIGAYLIGLTVCLAHWIFYRTHRVPTRKKRHPHLPIYLTCLLLAITTGIACGLYFNNSMRAHFPRLKQYVLTQKAWWNQSSPLLPVYSTNRFGRPIGLFNLQYLGSLDKFEQALTNYGWKKKKGSLFYSILMSVGGQNASKKLPFMAQLYLNKKPSLILTYQTTDQNVYILRLWRSNYHLLNYHQPIWLGSILYLQIKPKTTAQTHVPIFKYLLPALNNFEFNRIPLPQKQIKSLQYNTEPALLMIKETRSE